MTVSKKYIQNKIYSDKFDSQEVSNLSLFLFTHQYILMGRNRNDQIIAIHQEVFEDRGFLRNLLNEDVLFKMDIPTQVHVHNERFNLVPEVLYDSAFDASYLFFSGENLENQQTFHSSFKNSESILVGCLDQDLFDLIATNKREITFHHGACSFLSYALIEKAEFIDQEILVVIYDDFCYMAAFTNQELTIFNRFEVNNKESLLEYISGITNQLSFNNRYHRVSFLGKTENLAISNAWGKEYFWNCKLPIPEPNQNYPEELLIFEDSMLFESYYEFK